MILDNDIKLDFKDVLIVPQKSSLKSRSDVNLTCSYKFKYCKDYTWSGIPVVISNMDTTGTFSMLKSACEYNIFTCIHKHYSVDEWRKFRDDNDNDNIYNFFSVSCGSRDEDILKAHEILIELPKIKFICLDVANGYTESFVSIVKTMREIYPDKVIIAGSVVTGEMTKELLENGADIIKIGIGSGSVCTTRKKTGVGYPQVSAIIECSKVARELGGHIMSDGGCTGPGDFSKAFGCGAHFVMSGGIFAGHQESGGTIIEKNKEKYIEFYGMSSSTAMNKYSGGIAKYRTSEGKIVLLKYKGKVENTILDVLGGIRSTCTYIGISKLDAIYDNTKFIRVSQQLNEIYGSS